MAVQRSWRIWAITRVIAKEIDGSLADGSHRSELKVVGVVASSSLASRVNVSFDSAPRRVMAL